MILHDLVFLVLHTCCRFFILEVLDCLKLHQSCQPPAKTFSARLKNGTGFWLICSLLIVLQLKQLTYKTARRRWKMFHTFSWAFYQMEAGNKSKGFRKGSVEFSRRVQTVTSKVHILPWYCCLVAMVENNQGKWYRSHIQMFLVSVNKPSVFELQFSPSVFFFFFFKSAFGQGLKIPLSVHPPHLRAQLVVSARGPHLSDQWERVAQSAGNWPQMCRWTDVERQRDMW